MMHYLLFTVGTDGDLNPYLALGEALRGRGHRVTLLTNPSYETVVKGIGLEFIAIGDRQRLDDYVNHPDYFDASKCWKLALEACFLGPMRQTYETIAEHHASGPTTVISAAWGFGARIAHEKLGVPLVTIHLEPHNVRSMYQTGVMPPPMVVDDWVPRFMKRIQFWIADRWFVDPRICPQVNAFRNELGLPPVRRLVYQWWNSSQRIIGLYPEWLVPTQPDWPSQLELAGLPLWDRPMSIETTAEATEFARQSKPIVFTSGSNDSRTHSFFATAIECCEKLDCCGVLVGKQPIDIPSHLSGTVKRWYVPYSRLFPHAAAIVHHGGVGTAAKALAAGAPQLVIPSVCGQPDIAARLKRIGVAETLKPTAFSTRRAVNALRRLLDSPEVARRCRLYQQKMQSEDAIARTCDLIEQLADSPSAGRTATERRSRAA